MNMQTIENHKSETLLMYKDEHGSEYHAIGLKVGYYSPRFNEVYSDLDNWGFTPEEVESGVFIVETYGTGDCTNKYIDPVCIGYGYEGNIPWIKMLEAEANGGEEAPHMPPIREQWGKEYHYNDFSLIVEFLHHPTIFKALIDNYDFENNWLDFLSFCIDIYNAEAEEECPLDAYIHFEDASTSTDRGIQYGYEPVDGYIIRNV